MDHGASSVEGASLFPDCRRYKGFSPHQRLTRSGSVLGQLIYGAIQCRVTIKVLRYQ